jgi:hypothetical protein
MLPVVPLAHRLLAVARRICLLRAALVASPSFAGEPERWLPDHRGRARGRDSRALIAPHAMDREIAPGATLASIAISATTIRFLVKGPSGATATLRLEHPGARALGRANGELRASPRDRPGAGGSGPLGGDARSAGERASRQRQRGLLAGGAARRSHGARARAAGLGAGHAQGRGALDALGAHAAAEAVARGARGLARGGARRSPAAAAGGGLISADSLCRRWPEGGCRREAGAPSG